MNESQPTQPGLNNAIALIEAPQLSAIIFDLTRAQAGTTTVSAPHDTRGATPLNSCCDKSNFSLLIRCFYMNMRTTITDIILTI